MLKKYLSHKVKAMVKAMAFLLSLSFGTSLAVAADYTMRLSHQYPPTHPAAQAMERFAEEVKSATNEQVEVQIFGAAQLYKPNQHHRAVAGGQIEAAIILSMQWGGTIPEMSVGMIPYFMPEPEKQKAFMGSEAATFLDQKMLEKGVRNIAWIVESNDLIFTSSKGLLNTPESFKDIKIRGINKQFDEGLIALKAVPVSMPGSEAYQGLQTGVVDAGITALNAAVSRKYYEVQKYGTASPIVVIFNNLVVNPKWWDGLPEELQTSILEVADGIVKDSIISYEGVNQDHMKALRDNGMEAVELTADEVEALKAIMQPAVMKDFLKETGKDGEQLIEMINAL